MPARRSSSSSIRPCGNLGAALPGLDAEASFAIALDYTAPVRLGPRVELGGGFGCGAGSLLRTAVSLDEVQHPSPRVVACRLPLLEAAVEKAVRCTLVD